MGTLSELIQEKIDNNKIVNVLYNGTGIGKLTLNDSQVWETPFKYSFTSYSNIVSAKNLDRIEGKIVLPSNYNGKELNYVGDFEDCEYLEEIVIPDGYKAIQDNGFSGCTELKRVRIPNTIENIYETPFWGCDNLNYTTSRGVKYLGNEGNQYLAILGRDPSESACSIIPLAQIMSEYCFYQESFSEVIFEPNSRVKKIPYSAFYHCEELESIYLPDSLEEIKEEAFSGCFSLTDVTFGQAPKIIGDSAFSSCSSLEEIVLPEGVETIYECAFAYCDALWKIVLPKSLKYIGGYLFEDCYQLTEINYNGTIAEWNALNKEDNWFAYSSISKIVCSDGELAPYENVEPGLYATGSNYSLRVLTWEQVRESGVFDPTYFDEGFLTSNNGEEYPLGTLPQGELMISENIEHIGTSAFECAEQITKIIVPNELIYFNDENLINQLQFNISTGGRYISGKTNPHQVFYRRLNENLNTVSFNQQTKILAARSLAGSTLENITIPEGVLGISDYAFSGSKSLQSVVLPQSLINIGREAFSGCSVLSDINIPNNVQKIPQRCFRNCTTLNNIYLPPNIIEIGKEAFLGCTALTSAELDNKAWQINNKKYAITTQTSGATNLVALSNYVWTKTTLDAPVIVSATLKTEKNTDMVEVLIRNDNLGDNLVCCIGGTATGLYNPRFGTLHKTLSPGVAVTGTLSAKNENNLGTTFLTATISVHFTIAPANASTVTIMGSQQLLKPDN